MKKIITYNFDGLCVQSHCGERYTHYCPGKINGLEVTLGFCKEHALQFEKGGAMNNKEYKEASFNNSVGESYA